MERTNALAELAEDLDAYWTLEKQRRDSIVDTVQLIVAELAKVSSAPMNFARESMACVDIAARSRRKEPEMASENETVEELREALKEAIASEYGRCHSRWPCALCSKDCKIKRWRKALKGAKMASDATIRAIEARMNDLGFKRNNMKQWMESMRRESIQNYRRYKSAKADYIRLCRSIKELKDDLRRLKDGN